MRRNKRVKNTSKHQAGSRGPATFCQGQLRCFITTLLLQTRWLVWPWPGSHGSCVKRPGGPWQPQQQCPHFHDLCGARGHSWRQLQHHLLGAAHPRPPLPQIAQTGRGKATGPPGMKRQSKGSAAHKEKFGKGARGLRGKLESWCRQTSVSLHAACIYRMLSACHLIYSSLHRGKRKEKKKKKGTKHP